MKLMNENSHVVYNNNKNTKYVPVATLNQQLSLHCQLFFLEGWTVWFSPTKGWHSKSLGILTADKKKSLVTFQFDASFWAHAESQNEVTVSKSKVSIEALFFLKKKRRKLNGSKPL